MTEPIATSDYRDLTSALEFLKRTRWELRELRKVRVWADRLQVFDVNGDFFELRGVGYPNAEIASLLRAINAAFDPETIQQPPPSGEYRELGTGRRHTWAEDRVM
jgi:hypothetical protein